MMRSGHGQDGVGADRPDLLVGFAAQLLREQLPHGFVGPAGLCLIIIHKEFLYGLVAHIFAVVHSEGGLVLGPVFKLTLVLLVAIQEGECSHDVCNGGGILNHVCHMEQVKRRMLIHMRLLHSFEAVVFLFSVSAYSLRCKYHIPTWGFTFFLIRFLTSQ